MNHSGGSWITIGENGNGVGTLTLKDSASFISPRIDFNIGDSTDSEGTVTVQDSATLDVAGQIFVGKNTATGTLNVSGGTVTAGNWVNIAAVGATSTGTLNVTGGLLNHLLESGRHEHQRRR